MKNVSPANNSAKKNAAQGNLWVKTMRNLTPQQWKIARSLAVSLLLLGIALTPSVAPLAQKKEGPVKVTGVTSRKAADGGTVVTVSADAPLTRTQTWQDDEGFHLTLPKAGSGDILKGLPRGVTVRNLGKSLEVVVGVKQGTNVTVDPQSNHLNLIVNGPVEAAQGEAKIEPQTKNARSEEPAATSQDNAQPAARSPRERRPGREASPSAWPATTEPDYSQRASTSSKGLATSTQAYPAAPGAATPAASSAPSVPQPNASPATGAQQPQLIPTTGQGIVAPGSNPPPDAPSAITESNDQAQSGGLFSYIFSMTGVLVCLLLGMVALFIVRKRQAARDSAELNEGRDSKEDEISKLASLDEPAAVEARPKKERRKLLRRRQDKALVKMNGVTSQEAESDSNETIEKRPVAPVQPALYGAYRVDQEVGKLVLGQAHRMDVLSSRAPDDRRAIETSLIKALTSTESGEEGQVRAREALEEYGFVARQCASLLLANNAYDRASSARVLGDIGSQSSMPFLLEALYDSETIVRSEAVKSLGSLKMPSAIGALLDMARRHPEMPSSLLTGALNACTFQSLDFLDMPAMDLPLLDAGDETSYPGEITHLDPAAAVEDLPEWFEDAELSENLERLSEADVEARASAARRLSQFPVQRSVEALTEMAENDSEAVVRAAAVTSLSEIAHETVFAPIIMAFGDDAREVRAAAARALSRMDFDRGEAYVRLIETADAAQLQKVAQACIKAGMASQAIERVISEDRRLAYEAFSLLSLLAKSGEIEPLVDAICDHAEVNVRLAIIRLLGTAGQPDVATVLRHLAVREGLPEKVRSSIMEVVYKMDQTAEVSG